MGHGSELLKEALLGPLVNPCATAPGGPSLCYCAPSSVPVQAEEQALAARRDAAEMSTLKQQLHALQMAGSGAGGGKENSGAVGSTAAAAPLPAAGPPAPEAAAAGGAAGAYHAQAAGGAVLQGQLCEAVQRLLRERELLLDRCVYVCAGLAGLWCCWQRAQRTWVARWA